MRFTHPELYVTRYSFPREEALSEMRGTGLLHRGMARDAVHRLLGYPDFIEKYDGIAMTIERTGSGERGEGGMISTTESSIPPKEVWVYDGLKRSRLRVHFSVPCLKVTRFEWMFDEVEGRVVVQDHIW